jgi:2-polyprenyl-3-methyl-5-hydroxy-6-metoxy-1,4-benzoquinol methylase
VKRVEAPELMDADDLPADTYAAVVGDLARVNRVTLAYRPTLNFLARAAQASRRLRILDVGFGDGDTLRRIAGWAAAHGIEAELTGIDLNPRSALAAQAHGPAALPIRYLTGDYADLTGEGWDVVISSLVAHHMTRAELLAFLRFMEAHAQVGWLVNDLHRHRVAHLGWPLLAAVARWHPIVRHDGHVSIARSFVPADWHQLLAEAGITGATVRRRFPFRLCVERLR